MARTGKVDFPRNATKKPKLLPPRKGGGKNSFDSILVIKYLPEKKICA
jgi:hypothetical protein